MSTAPEAFAVVLTADAQADLEDIIDWIAVHDSAGAADHVLTSLVQVLDSLAYQPDRGSRPRELLDLGIRQYRQVFFKPYRVIYQVMDRRVVVFLIADGRRDMQTLLQRRLLAG